MTAKEQATASGALASDFHINSVSTAQAQRYLQYGNEHQKALPGPDRNQRIVSASVTLDERYLATATGGSISIYATETFKIITVLEISHGCIDTIEFGKFSNKEVDGYVLASDSSVDGQGKDGIVCLWYLDRYCQKASLENSRYESDFKKDVLPQVTFKGRFATFGSSVFSHDHKTLLYLNDIDGATSNGYRISAFDIVPRKEKFVLEGCKATVTQAEFSLNDRFIASTAQDGYLKLYNGASGKLIRDSGPTGGQNWACDFSLDSRFVAVISGGSRPTTFIWRTDDPEGFPSTLKDNDSIGRVLSQSPDTRSIAIGARDRRLVIFNAQTTAIDQVWQLANSTERNVREVTEIKWLKGGKKIVFKPGDGSIKMYDFEQNIKQKWGLGPHDV